MWASFGYTDDQGKNQVVTISPPSTMSGTTLRDQVHSALQVTQRNPLWVEADPPTLATALAAKLSIPNGRPSDWDGLLPLAAGGIPIPSNLRSHG